MRRIIYGVFLFAGFLAASLGLGKQEAQAAPLRKATPAIDNACHDGLVFSDILKHQESTLVAGHYSHSSHRSHYSSRY